MNAEVWQRAWQQWWPHWRVVWPAYCPNALAANVLLERAGLPVVPLIWFCLAADLAIYGLLSWTLRGWLR